MGSGLGKNFARLIEDLEKNGPSYSFFYAMFLAEKAMDKLHPKRNKAVLESKGLKLRPYEHYVYPPRNIRSFRFDDDEMSFVLNFMGLYGVNSPLPRTFHEEVAAQLNTYSEGEAPLQNFLDIFNSRFYWFYYQAWKKYRNYLQMSDNENSKAMQQLLAFSGIGLIGEIGEVLRPHRMRLMRLSGILSQRVRNKEGLLILLEEFFPDRGFWVEEFIPTMVKLSERPKIGRKFGSQTFTLGDYSVLGRYVRDNTSRIRIIVGPIEYDDYLQFAPGGSYRKLLVALLQLYVNDGIEYDIRFVLYSGRIRSTSLGSLGNRLGQSTWLGKPAEWMVDVEQPYERLLENDIKYDQQEIPA